MIAHISAEHMVQQIEFHLIKMWQERQILAIFNWNSIQLTTMIARL